MLKKSLGLMLSLVLLASCGGGGQNNFTLPITNNNVGNNYAPNKDPKKSSNKANSTTDSNTENDEDTISE